jgi:hypothetical protein
MKKIISTCIAIAVAIFVIPGCSKKKGCKDPISVNYDKDAEEDDGSCLYGGTGGDVTVAAFPKHHGVEIFSTDSAHLDSAYVKFNATNSPGTSPSSYDLAIAGEVGENHVHIEGLKKGKYFIMMAGYDTSISQRVFGGAALEITQSSGEIDLNVAVTE